MHRLVLALVATFMCAGLAIPAGRASVPAAIVAIKVAATRRPNPPPSATPRNRWRHYRSHVADPGIALVAIESEIDEDEDSLRESSEHADVDVACLPLPREPDAPGRRDHSTDPSRFARGAALPRGPPNFV